MDERVISLARASAIEAVEADIEASGVIDGIKALSAVFSVHRLRWSRWTELCAMLVRLSSVPWNMMM